MKQKFFAIFVMWLCCIHVFSQTDQKIVLPDFGDKYSKYVQQLEAGQLDIDYQDFRFSFLKSQQFTVALEKSSEFGKLKKEMYKQMDSSNYQEVITLSQRLLSIDYTSLIAHKILRQTYKIVGDSVHAAKYKTIELGLFNSILDHGDGTSVKTAWPVIQIDEEYFILGMLGAKLKEQALIGGKKPCDRMTVTEDGEKKVYYFDVSKVFEGYMK